MLPACVSAVNMRGNTHPMGWRACAACQWARCCSCVEPVGGGGIGCQRGSCIHLHSAHLSRWLAHYQVDKFKHGHGTGYALHVVIEMLAMLDFTYSDGYQASRSPLKARTGDKPSVSLLPLGQHAGALACRHGARVSNRKSVSLLSDCRFNHSANNTRCILQRAENGIQSRIFCTRSIEQA